jgi:hypothetical protein
MSVMGFLQSNVMAIPLVMSAVDVLCWKMKLVTAAVFAVLTNISVRVQRVCDVMERLLSTHAGDVRIWRMSRIHHVVFVGWTSINVMAMKPRHAVVILLQTNVEAV